MIDRLLVDFPELYEQAAIEVPEGWAEHVYNMSLELAQIDELRIDQIKEKYAELCVYTNWYTMQVNTIINHYEDLCSTTCQACGKPGRLTGKGWVYIACPEHTKEL
jgi:hypothetical protein